MKKMRVSFERQVNQDLFIYIMSKIVDFDNFEEIQNSTFELRPYDWNEPKFPKPNFYHKPSGFKLWFYKYPLRSPEVNFNISHYEFSCILYDCVNSVLSAPDKTFKVKYEIEKWWEINNESNKS